jgi:hypothetical protein
MKTYKAKRRTEAEQRQANRDVLTNEEQLARIRKRTGSSLKEKNRLWGKINAGKVQ